MLGNVIFKDRKAAGQALAEALDAYRGRDDVLVLALPRGGVAVAFEVADYLQAPLDVLIVRKLGVPSQPELAMGAIASGGIRILNDEVVQMLHISQEAIERVARIEEAEVARREWQYRGDRAPQDVGDKIVILVDDGVATGSTMRAGIQALRKFAPARIVVAVPHGPVDTCEMLAEEADELVCLGMPEPYFAVGAWYSEFPQLSDEQVADLLMRASTGSGDSP